MLNCTMEQISLREKGDMRTHMFVAYGEAIASTATDFPIMNYMTDWLST